MRYRPLTPKCDCGACAQLVSVGLTDQYELLITAFCVPCMQPFQTTVALTDLSENCPAPAIQVFNEKVGNVITHIIRESEGSIPPIVAAELTVTDLDQKFEQDCGICP